MGHCLYLYVHLLSSNLHIRSLILIVHFLHLQDMLILKETMYDILAISFHNDTHLKASIELSIQSIFKSMPDSPKYFARCVVPLMKRDANIGVVVLDPELDKLILLSSLLSEKQQKKFRKSWDKKQHALILADLDQQEIFFYNDELKMSVANAFLLQYRVAFNQRIIDLLMPFIPPFLLH